jgi:integrase
MGGHPPTDPDTMQRVKRRLARRVGFHFVAHQLRDTFSTRLFDAEVDDRIVKELIGHTTGVTGRYVEVSRRRKQDAIAKLSYQVGCGSA